MESNFGIITVGRITVLALAASILLSGCDKNESERFALTSSNGQESVFTDETTDTEVFSAPEDTAAVTEAGTEAETEGSSETETEEVMGESASDPVTKGDGKPNDSGTDGCAHGALTTVGERAASCASEGYTGDSVCSLCGAVVAYGSATPKSTSHGATEQRQVERDGGIANDEICTVCGVTVKEGIPLKHLEPPSPDVSYLTYTNEIGDSITVPEGTDIFAYTLEQANMSAPSQLPAVEAEILRLINAERANAGLTPFTNVPNAYFYAKTRTSELISSFSHTRPDGRSWVSVFSDYRIFFAYSAENLAKGTGIPVESIAAAAVEGWMGSPGHRANILSPEYTMSSIAVIYDEATKVHYITHHFFGS